MLPVGSKTMFGSIPCFEEFQCGADDRLFIPGGASPVTPRLGVFVVNK
jgi:hypothetical protein